MLIYFEHHFYLLFSHRQTSDYESRGEVSPRVSSKTEDKIYPSPPLVQPDDVEEVKPKDVEIAPPVTVVDIPIGEGDQPSSPAASPCKSSSTSPAHSPAVSPATSPAPSDSPKPTPTLEAPAAYKDPTSTKDRVSAFESQQSTDTTEHIVKSGLSIFYVHTYYL